MDSSKKYGLFHKKDLTTPTNRVLKKPSIFNEDSDSDGESNVDWVKKTLQKEPYGGGATTRMSKAEIQKVLNEDPTAYQYDEVYDEIEKKRAETVAIKKTDRKPKYIENLLATAERRKRENERRLARQIQKERDAEGDEFADKEVFVTSAYKKKLEEIRKMDEEDERMGVLEDIGDVTKQQDISGFYRHLYSVTVATENNPEPEKDVKMKPSSASQANRQYRKRKSSESSDNEEAPNEEIKNQESIPIKTEPGDNIDADSPLSSDHEDKEDSPTKSKYTESKDATDIKEEPKDEEKVENGEANKDEENKENVVEKPKRSIWLKRTIGEVYDAALQRYYERKNQKLASVTS